jgi:hypothetical protein
MVVFRFSVSTFHSVQKAFLKTTGWSYEDNNLILRYNIVFIVEFLLLWMMTFPQYFADLQDIEGFYCGDSIIRVA